MSNETIVMVMDDILVLKKVKDFVVNYSFADKSKIKDETLIFKEGFFDSMGFVSLITFLEQEFKITTQDRDLIESNFESINAIVSYVSRKRLS